MRVRGDIVQVQNSDPFARFLTSAQIRHLRQEEGLVCLTFH